MANYNLNTTPVAIETAANGFPTLRQSVLEQANSIDKMQQDYSGYKAAVADYITEQGTKNGWYYRYWKSGIKECWTRGTKSGINMATNNFRGYVYSNPVEISLPFAIAPLYAECNGGSTSTINALKQGSLSGNIFRFWVYGHDTQATNISITYNLYVIGK